MNTLAFPFISAILMGLGATLTFDLWALFLKHAFKITPSSSCLVGRWLRYMPEGTFPRFSGQNPGRRLWAGGPPLGHSMEMLINRIIMTPGDDSLPAELNDSPTAQQIWAALPLEGQAKLWGDEIYFEIPVNASPEPASTERYSLTQEQALVLTEETSPYFLVGAFQGAYAGLKVTEQIQEAFRTGEGLGWHEHDHELFIATERLFKPGYATNLVDVWIPALDGVKEKLETGARVADVGCGYGASTIIMAQAFPNSQFVGFDYRVDNNATNPKE